MNTYFLSNLKIAKLTPLSTVFKRMLGQNHLYFINNNKKRIKKRILYYL